MKKRHRSGDYFEEKMSCGHNIVVSVEDFKSLIVILGWQEVLLIVGGSAKTNTYQATLNKPVECFFPLNAMRCKTTILRAFVWLSFEISSWCRSDQEMSGRCDFAPLYVRMQVTLSCLKQSCFGKRVCAWVQISVCAAMSMVKTLDPQDEGVKLWESAQPS